MPCCWLEKSKHAAETPSYHLLPISPSCCWAAARVTPTSSSGRHSPALLLLCTVWMSLALPELPSLALNSLSWLPCGILQIHSHRTTLSLLLSFSVRPKALLLLPGRDQCENSSTVASFLDWDPRSMDNNSRWFQPEKVLTPKRASKLLLGQSSQNFQLEFLPVMVPAKVANVII